MLCKGLIDVRTKTNIASKRVAVSHQRKLFHKGLPVEEVAAFKRLGASFTAAGQAVQEMENHLNTSIVYLWSRREILRKTKSWTYMVVARAILL